MNFTIKRYEENGLSLIRLTDNAEGSYVETMPGFGALLHSFVVNREEGPLNIIDNYKTPAELAQFLTLSYKGCKLSPFACRIPAGKYKIDGTEYELSQKFKDGSAIHGLLFNKPFQVTNEFVDDTMASLSLRYHYKKDDPGFPFEYICEIRYILQPGNVLQIETTITNLDDESIPVVDGWHPYFHLGNVVDDYIIQFSSSSMLEFDDNLVPTGNIVEEPSFQTAHRLGDRTIDNCYILDLQQGLPCCIVYNPNNKLTLSFFASNGYPYLQIFTPDHRQSIAIENLSGAPNSFNNGIGLIELLPRRSETFNVWYRVDLPA
jgi:aldose 1-epimerase